MITITQFEEKYTNDIIDLVLHFQNDGTRPLVTVADQPDLLNIREEYINAGGNFWIAKDNERLIGSVGIMPVENNIAVMKKFFVYEEYQSEPHHTGRKLYAKLLDFAKDKKFIALVLDTPHNTVRAHDFYHRAGFRQITEEELPVKFHRPYKESDFFLLKL